MTSSLGSSMTSSMTSSLGSSTTGFFLGFLSFNLFSRNCIFLVKSSSCLFNFVISLSCCLIIEKLLKLDSSKLILLNSFCKLLIFPSFSSIVSLNEVKIHFIPSQILLISSNLFFISWSSILIFNLYIVIYLYKVLNYFYILLTRFIL